MDRWEGGVSKGIREDSFCTTSATSTLVTTEPS